MSCYQHKYFPVIQSNYPGQPCSYYFICKKCGDEKPLENGCVIDISHQHNFCNYSGMQNGFHLFRCSDITCDTLYKLFPSKSEKPETIINFNNKRLNSD
jgi:hypothetical protein